ncbi:MAG TPA: phospholipid carrier-dependent glycosyltransferase [Thermoanaerobaculia bacterium]|nr:phospholipid carrier-dependent glycosyltransferase [Thermoanaerobaculia bacterium]
MLLHALYAFAAAVLAYNLGRLFVPDRSFAMSTALGLGILGEALFLLAALGLLTRWSVSGVLVLACFFVRRFVLPSPVWIATAPAFLLALYPPTGFDATLYHLPFARLFAETGRLAFADTLRFPVFPQLGELLFSGAMLVTDDVTAQLTQWLALAVTTVAIATMVERRAAILAVALWLGTPLALYLGGNAYIDCSLTMFVTLAFAAYLQWRRSEERTWAVLAGAFAGFAASTKYHGLFFVAVLLLAIAWKNRRAAAAFALVALLLAGPWYARIWAETGNPLFPYFSSIFGRHEWQTTLDQRLERTASHPMTAAPTENPLTATIHRAIGDPLANGMAPHSPWVVLLLPFAVVAAVREPRLRFPLGAALGYALLVSPLDWRFMIAIVPLVCIGIAAGLPRMRHPAVLALVAVLLAAPGLAWSTLLLYKYGPIPAAQQARDAFLAKRIPVYEALRGRHEVVYLLHAENAHYYCPTRCLGEVYGPYRYAKVDPLLHDPARLAATLRGFGAEVVVLDKRRDALPLPRLFEGERGEALAIGP